MFKNPISYYKLTDGSWDFDTLMDMLFSFFVLTEIPDTHPKVSERLPYAPPSSCAAAPHRPRVAAPRPSRNLSVDHRRWSSRRPASRSSARAPASASCSCACVCEALPRPPAPRPRLRARSSI